MELLGKIRRMHVRDKLSERGNAKRMGLSRNTVHKWLKTPEEVEASKYVRAKKFGKLSVFTGELEQALKADAHRSKQDQRTAKALFVQIKARGYQGGYSRVTDFIRQWRATEGKRPHAFVPLKFDLGEAFQFDWSEEGLVVGGIYRRMQVSHMKLSASRAFWLVAYPKALHEVLKELDDSDWISCSRFGSQVAHDTPGLVPCSGAHIQKVARCIAGTNVDLGGTEMHAALLSSFSQSTGRDWKSLLGSKAAPDVSRDVLLITDGDIWDLEGGITSAQACDHRVFGIGVGSAPAESLFREVAERTRGGL